MPMPPDWLLWQLVDSALPTGGFAHSAGLEAAHHARLAPPHALPDLLHAALDQAAHAGLPFVNAGHAADTPGFPQLDAEADAFLSNHVARRASSRQGQAFLATAADTFAEPGSPLHRFRDLARAHRLPTHLAPAFGHAAALLHLPADQARRAYLFTSLRAVASAAVRLGILGPLAAQRLQHRLAPHADALAEDARHATPEDAASTAPLLDLVHASHDGLYSRLFQS